MKECVDFQEPGEVLADGSVDYYKRRHADFIRRYGDKFSPPKYYLNYGKKYAMRFTYEVKPQLSPTGKAWLDQVRKNLQIAMEEYCQNNKEEFDKLEKNDKLFTEFAFGTHAAAYWDAGLRELPFSDVKIVGATPDFSDMVSWSGIHGSADVVLRLIRETTISTIDSVTREPGAGVLAIRKGKQTIAHISDRVDGVLGDGSVAVVVNCVEGGGKKGLKVLQKGYEACLFCIGDIKPQENYFLFYLVVLPLFVGVLLLHLFVQFLSSLKPGTNM